jgi:hypothetical protein
MPDFPNSGVDAHGAQRENPTLPKAGQMWDTVN